MRTIAALALAAGCAALAPARAVAQPADDPVGDFLPDYAGPQNGDVDITRVRFTWNGQNTFRLFSRSAGDIGQTEGALFVWGINRGQGVTGFPTLAPGVLFDAVVVANPNGGSFVRDILGGTTTALPVGAVRFSGADLFVDVSAALLPTRGFALGSYTANLWPRVGLGSNDQISDFAPNNSNIAVSAVPEPGTAALALPALGLLAAAASARRRRSA